MSEASHILKPHHGLIKVVGSRLVLLRLESLLIDIALEVFTATGRHGLETCTKGSLLS